ncbi:hypothetical protein NCAS_0A08510 [Naumovozyma castellii]|uniref:Uncharacterized protein n=1 Tax=Naumovozyma castellii TaxID=27288 RepID=G0V7G1_NAUCA|nr:hypothetical protein NCAS_0A08510 [Naumovozyma castellii CBS 4309]CCC67409.1 hypothetical protein NCAS_0A08510 [Naumovozyma castellii CBS 4309]
MTSTKPATSSQKNYDTVTLKTLTAYQLLSQRENMCELFHLVDESERQRSNNTEMLSDLKKRLEAAKNENK